jgi:hypothetical protein
MDRAPSSLDDRAPVCGSSSTIVSQAAGRGRGRPGTGGGAGRGRCLLCWLTQGAGGAPRAGRGGAGRLLPARFVTCICACIVSNACNTNGATVGVGRPGTGGGAGRGRCLLCWLTRLGACSRLHMSARRCRSVAGQGGAGRGGAGRSLHKGGCGSYLAAITAREDYNLRQLVIVSRDVVECRAGVAAAVGERFARLGLGLGLG